MLAKNVKKQLNIIIISTAAVDSHIKRKGCQYSTLMPVPRPPPDMEIANGDDKKEEVDEEEVMPVISMEDILHNSPFIALGESVSDDEDDE